MTAPPLAVTSGNVLLYTVFDVAEEADLVAVERILRARPPAGTEAVARLSLERPRAAVAFTNPPVTARLGDRSIRLGGRDHPVQASARLHDFGALTVLWSMRIPSGTTIDELVAWSTELGSAEVFDQCAVHARRDAEVVLEAVSSGLTDPGLRPDTERLTVFSVATFDRPVTSEELRSHPALPALVTGEHERFSEQFAAELRSTALSYSDRDLVVLGYDQAFVVDPAGAADVAALLEFALAQVLELGYYDELLDTRLAQAADAVSTTRLAGGRWGFGRPRSESVRRELLRQHVDLVEVIERVTAAVKVTEDFYYAKVYRDAMRVFRADELIDAIDRKLELMFRTYTMLADEVDSQASHRLEWIIILLILFEIVMGLLDRLA